MKNLLVIMVLLIAANSFAVKNMADIVFREGGLSIIPGVAAGHVAVYVSAQDAQTSQSVYEYMPKDKVYSTGGDDGGMFEMPFSTFKHYGDHKYLGAKTTPLIDPYRLTAVTNVIKTMEGVFTNSEYGSVYKLLPDANGEDNNNDGFNETFNCVTFTEFVYENCKGLDATSGTGLGGVNATPNEYEIGAGYPLTPEEQFSSELLTITNEEGCDAPSLACDLTAIIKENSLEWLIENDAEQHKIKGFNIYSGLATPENKLNQTVILNGVNKQYVVYNMLLSENDLYWLEVVYKNGLRDFVKFEK